MRLLQVISAFSMLLMMSACEGGNYRTLYHYIPPKAELDLDCVDECANDKRYCFCVCGNRLDACEQGIDKNASSNYSSHTDKPYGQSQLSCDQHFKACTVRCNEDYRDCYGDCGGKVVKEKRCMKNCDSAEEWWH